MLINYDFHKIIYLHSWDEALMMVMIKLCIYVTNWNVSFGSSIKSFLAVATLYIFFPCTTILILIVTRILFSWNTNSDGHFSFLFLYFYVAFLWQMGWAITRKLVWSAVTSAKEDPFQNVSFWNGAWYRFSFGLLSLLNSEYISHSCFWEFLLCN